jgi:aqualysin 1
MRKHLAFFVLLAIAIGSVDFGPLDAQAPSPGRGQARGRLLRKGARAIPNRYIVVLREDAEIATGDYARVLGRVQAVTRGRGAVPEHVYAKALRGFAAFMSDEDAVAMSLDPQVAYVEEDSVVTAFTTQASPPAWGLDRIAQRGLPLNNSYGYTTTGSGVNVYVIDTGIRLAHTQFGGRARSGFTAIIDGRGTADCNGHGTHVAGTIGASTYGVAKKVNLIAVRVLDCGGYGTVSGVVAGVDWVTTHRVRPAVANMSLGGGASSSLDTAVRNSIAAGVTYAVAAGNSTISASSVSPARVGEAITVGSSTRTDARSSFSNVGSVVDIFAPGSSIRSTWYTSNTATNIISGTSMASPHVAGVAARYLQNHRTASPATVRTAIVNASSKGMLTGIPTGTPNRLLFWLAAQ